MSLWAALNALPEELRTTMTEQEALEKLKEANARLGAAGMNCGRNRGNGGGHRAESAYTGAAKNLENVYKEVKPFLPADMPIIPRLKKKYRIGGAWPSR